MSGWKTILLFFLLLVLSLGGLAETSPEEFPGREVFLSRVVEGLGLALPRDPGDPFVSIDEEYAAYYAAAESSGLISLDFLEKHGQPLTREEAVAIMMRALEEKEVDLAILEEFKDGMEVSPELQPLVARAVQTGFLAGYPDKFLKPLALLDREAMDIFLERFGHVIRAHPLVDCLEIR